MQMSADSVSWTRFRREALEKLLRRHVEGEVRFDEASRVLYSTDASIYSIEPLGVLIPRTRADLVAGIQIAMEQRVPVIPRGSGTSLSGQSIGPGLVIDDSKYLSRILETDIHGGWVRVEPGVVLGALNKHLAPMGYLFGPDVATADRATLGGMIGNNSAGARSLRFGKTIDHVIEVEAILTGGQVQWLGPMTHAELLARSRQPGQWGRIHRAVHQAVSRNTEEIRQRFPQILRRVSGYNLDVLVPPAPMDLSRLMVGSEGTLATVAEARLRIVPVPKHRGIGVLHFASLESALDALRPVLETLPSAVELLDNMILDMARRSVLYRDRIDFVERRPAAILVVEYFEDEPGAVERRLDQLAALSLGPLVRTTDAKRCEHIWNVRKTALPLLLSVPGARKPIAFVEDTAVAPADLPEFVRRFRAILARYDTDGSFYGHASVGCLHIRPMLDLRRQDEVRSMARIAEEVVALVQEFGGAISGEHGDGLARSQFNQKFFGDAIYGAFCEIKRAFDPEQLMNPGKIVHAPPMTDSLRDREAANHPGPRETRFDYQADGGAIEVARRCNGNALCRRDGTGTMCPSFMATKAEEHSPRGRANLLRAAMEGRLPLDRSGSWATESLGAALDLCLGCKACKSECPSNVDIAKLKAEFLAERYRRRPRPWRDRAQADYRAVATLGARLAPFSNWLMRSWPARWALDRFVGLDRRRPLPKLHRTTLEHWFRRHRSESRRLHGKVVLLADCFTNFHEPAVGRDAVTLLEWAGYQVHLAPICCGRVMISRGFLELAQQRIRENIQRLLPFAEEGVVILGTEPSCLFTLVDEWPDLVPGEEARLVARQARLVETWLDQRTQWGGTDLPPPRATPLEVLLHGHCHQKAAGAVDGTLTALRRLAGVDPELLDAGCCGMAGAFGHEREHYELSVAIAESRLLPALRRSPAASIVAGGFSCRSQISDLARRKAFHPVQLIRRRIEPDSS